MKYATRTSMVAAAAVVLAAGPAWAVLGTVNPTKSNGNFIAGSGIPANNFEINTAGTGESVALKARLRNGGQALKIVGTTYFVPTGLAAGGDPAWMFDWQFTPPDNVLVENTDYTMTLEVDFDPGPGTDFAVLPAPYVRCRYESAQ